MTATSPQDEIPSAPPQALRSAYIKLSWAYVRWCLAMLAWAGLCIAYFAMTGQMIEMGIAIFLGVILVLMIAGPAFLFGGETWYKRLGWMAVLLSLFSLMWVYPLIAVGLGIRRRLASGRYTSWEKVFHTDVWHLAICAVTVIVALWTIVLTLRVLMMTRRLARGDYQQMDIRLP